MQQPPAALPPDDDDATLPPALIRELTAWRTATRVLTNRSDRRLLVRLHHELERRRSRPARAPRQSMAVAAAVTLLLVPLWWIAAHRDPAPIRVPSRFNTADISTRRTAAPPQDESERLAAARASWHDHPWEYRTPGCSTVFIARLPLLRQPTSEVACVEHDGICLLLIAPLKDRP